MKHSYWLTDSAIETVSYGFTSYHANGLPIG
jgi:hypothetical protein